MQGMILYVGSLDKQYERLCSRLEGLNYPVLYAADAIQAKRLVASITPVLVAIHSHQFQKADAADGIENLVQFCKYNRIDVIKMKDDGLSVVFNHRLSRPDFSSVS